MIQDIEGEKVKTVIVKDMSRLGRDYLKVGYFLEIFFPDNDVCLKIQIVFNFIGKFVPQDEFIPDKKFPQEYL